MCDINQSMCYQTTSEYMNCLALDLFATLKSIHRRSNYSSILRSVGVREIGRKSSWTDFGDCDLGIGTMCVLFQRLGTQPALIEELNMWQISSETKNAKSHRNLFGMSSGPGDL